MRAVTKDDDRIKPIENLLGGVASEFSNCSSERSQLDHTDQPFGFNYTFESYNYAKSAGNLLLVRPRVLGSKSSGVLETKEPRKFPVEFEGPSRDTDSFDIALPPGYEVDELPPPMDVDYSFGSYHSKTEANGQVLHYTRSPGNQGTERSGRQNGRAEKVLPHDRRGRTEYRRSETVWSRQVANRV